MSNALFFHSAYHVLHQSYQQLNLPSDFPNALLKSAGGSFLITTLLTSDINLGIKVGGIASLVTLVSVVTSRIIQSLSNQPTLSQVEYMAKLIVDLAVTHVILNRVFGIHLNILRIFVFSTAILAYTHRTHHNFPINQVGTTIIL